VTGETSERRDHFSQTGSPTPDVNHTPSNLGIREIQEIKWLTYRQAALYTGWSVEHLRNLVSAGQIPVYGKLRVRRFRRDMLDLFLTNPDAAMRKFRLERNAHGS
jgi:excisionase family DNA binding protein